MIETVRFGILGLGAGAIYGLVAIGLVVVYRGSGVVNFSHGAIGLTGAAVFIEVREGPGLAAGILAGLAASMVVGAAVQLLVLRRMRGASPIARLIATLAVLAFGLAFWERRYEGETLPGPVAVFPSDRVEPFGHQIFLGQDRLWILGLGVLVTFVLWAAYRWTVFGLATSAVAEDEDLAASLGRSPILVATSNWAIGGALAGLGGIMLASIAGLSPGNQVAVVIPALAAALVGGFASFPWTFAGGLAVGVLESEALRFSEPTGWTVGVPSAAPFVVIMVILVVRGRVLPLRSFLADRLPAIGSTRVRWRTGAVVALSLAVTVHAFTDSWTSAISTGAAVGLVALSLVVVVGLAGQLSLMQWTMAGVGALFAGRVAGDLWNLPMPLSLLFGILVAAPIGAVVAAPAVRLRGTNLAVATLASALVINTMVLSNHRYTGGPIRGTVIPAPRWLGIDVSSIVHPERYAIVSVLVLAVGAAAVANLRRGRAGRRLIAVRGNERAAASLGIDVVEAKVFAFSAASCLAAAGGGLIAFRNPRLNFDQFDLFGNIELLLFAVIGGIGFVSGALLAGATAPGSVMEHLIGLLGDPSGWYVMAAALVLVVVAMTYPDGVVPLVVARARKAAAPILRRREADGSEPSTSWRSEGAAQQIEQQVLEVSGLTVQYGTTVVLDAVDLQVAPGEVVGLIGPNGAGKTTLIDAVTGFARGGGHVRLGGTALDQLGPHERSRAGLGRSFQSLELFEDLSVLDNLRVSSDAGARSAYLTELVRPRTPPLDPIATAAVDEFGLVSVLHRRPAELSYAQRRLVAIARTVALAPSILLLDEPAAGLDATSTAELVDLIRRLAREWGMGILLVEHDVAMVMAACDRVVALDFGKVIADGTPEEVRTSPAVVAAYLGRDAVDVPVGAVP